MGEWEGMMFSGGGSINKRRKRKKKFFQGGRCTYIRGEERKVYMEERKS
jgi:hypothetical protein